MQHNMILYLIYVHRKILDLQVILYVLKTRDWSIACEKCECINNSAYIVFPPAWSTLWLHIIAIKMCVIQHAVSTVCENYLITASESFLLNFYLPFLGLGVSVGFMGGVYDSK